MDDLSYFCHTYGVRISNRCKRYDELMAEVKDLNAVLKGRRSEALVGTCKKHRGSVCVLLLTPCCLCVWGGCLPAAMVGQCGEGAVEVEESHLPTYNMKAREQQNYEPAGAEEEAAYNVDG